MRPYPRLYSRTASLSTGLPLRFSGSQGPVLPSAFMLELRWENRALMLLGAATRLPSGITVPACARKH